MEKIVLKDISEKEFSKIKEVLSDYISDSKDDYVKELDRKPHTLVRGSSLSIQKSKQNTQGLFDFEKVKSAVFSAPSGGTIVIDGLDKEDFRNLIVLIDFYNVWKTDNLKNSWDGELEEIYNKLTKKFIRIYKEQPYSDIENCID